jgi:acyl carrier protein
MARMTKEELLTVLRDELGVDTTQIEEDTPLFSSGAIDSFSLVSLILFIERKGVTVNALDVNLENLDSVERILRFANREDAESRA